MESLVLTFAEIGFLMRSYEPERIAVRERLRIEEPTDAVLAAGLASLVARRLCVRDGDEVRPEPVIMAVIASLSTAEIAVRALGTVGDRPVLVHVLRGPVATVAVSPAELGQFTVEVLDQSVALGEQLVRFYDAATSGDGESVVLVDAIGAREFSLAVARDGTGAWYLSDTVAEPDRGSPSSREEVVARIVELVDSPTSLAV